MFFMQTKRIEARDKKRNERAEQKDGQQPYGYSWSTLQT